MDNMNTDFDAKIVASLQKYKSAAAPQELERNLMIMRHDKAREHKNTVRRAALTCASIAVALLVAFAGTVNASAAFAEAVEDVPVIGHIAIFVNIRQHVEHIWVSPDDMQDILDSMNDNRDAIISSGTATVTYSSSTGGVQTDSNNVAVDDAQFEDIMKRHNDAMDAIKDGVAVSTSEAVQD
jgi:hypothetical protein